MILEKPPLDLSRDNLSMVVAPNGIELGTLFQEIFIGVT